MIILLYTVHVLICFFLIAVVLLQQGKGADLSVFGGGATQTAFGARGAATVLHKMTVVSFVLFIATTLVIGVVQSDQGSSDIFEDLDEEAAATATADDEATAEAGAGDEAAAEAEDDVQGALSADPDSDAAADGDVEAGDGDGAAGDGAAGDEAGDDGGTDDSSAADGGESDEPDAASGDTEG